MKTIITLLFITISALNVVNACDPFYASYCQTTQLSQFNEMHIFAGTIASKNDSNITLDVLEVLRGEESKTTITIWDGIYYEENDPICSFVSSGFTNRYGAVGDTIFCIVEFIEETETEVDVVGDYRRPSTWEIETFVPVQNGIVSSFSYYDNIMLPYNKFIIYACHANVYGCTDADACNYMPEATINNQSCYFDCEKPVINCPAQSVYFCSPSEIPPPMKLEDFDVTDNVTPANELFFSVSDNVSHFNQYTIYSYVYRFSDVAGNQTQCQQWFYMPDEILKPPAIDTTINICAEEDAIIMIKPFNDYYLFYEDNDGAVGSLIGKRDFGDVICNGENFGISTAKTGTHKFWASKEVRERFVFEDKPYYSCESEPVLFTVNITPAPAAVLKEDMPSMKLGEYYNLMDLVEENKDGYWRGKDVLSFGSANGQNNFYFYPKRTGLNKAFYTVQNGECSEIYTLVFDVQNFRLSENASFSDPLTVFPNPTKGEVFVNLSNAIDVEHTIEVYDINGKLHHQQTANNVKNNLFQLGLNHLSKGVYIIESRNPLGTNSEKIIIE